MLTSRPCRCFVELDFLRHHWIIWHWHHEVSLPSGFRGDMPLTESLSHQLQQHLRLGGSVPHADVARDTDRICIVVKTFVCHTVRKLGTVFREIRLQHLVARASLEILVTAQDLHDVNEAAAHTYDFQFDWTHFQNVVFVWLGSK